MFVLLLGWGKGAQLSLTYKKRSLTPTQETGRITSPRTVMECASIPQSLFGSFSSEKERFQTPAPKHNTAKTVMI
ncbi:MAG: hypothetical protein J1E79_05835, partial [Rikenella sp.]|nr:hypothetical protein [Rikenella sp.]